MKINKRQHQEFNSFGSDSDFIIDSFSTFEKYFIDWKFKRAAEISPKTQK